MAEDEQQAQEKTEQPSLKRLKEAREKGQVARSKDFNATLILLFSARVALSRERFRDIQVAEIVTVAKCFACNRSFLFFI